MSKVFGQTVRGNFKQITMNASSSIVQVPDLNVPFDCCFVSNTSVRKNEKRAIIQCFNSVNHIYAFGANPESSTYACSFSVFLSKCGSGKFQSTGGVNQLINSYKQKRVSKNPSIVTMSVDGDVQSGILVGLAVDVEDAELNLFRVTVMFNDLEP
jgi:hypothetical protein